MCVCVCVCVCAVGTGVSWEGSGVFPMMDALALHLGPWDLSIAGSE